MIKVIVSHVLIASLIVWSAHVQSAEVPQDDHPGPVETKATLEQVLDLIDRSRFSVDELLDRLDYDEQNIIRFVSGSVRFEQYPGVLRGPEATLAASAGNSLDQAVLLAKLLKDGGYDARILRSRISADDALTLLKSMASSDQAPSPTIGDIDRIKALFARPRYAESEFFQAISHFLASLTDASAAPMPGIASGVDDSEAVLHKLSDPLKQLDIERERDVTKSLVDEARDYFWVEYKADAGPGWQSVHPALPEGFALSETPTPTNYYTDQIPEDLTHRVSVQVFVEVERAGARTSVPITGVWQVPSSSLANRTVTYTNFPSGLLGNSVETFEEARSSISNSRFFLPTLNDAMAPQASGFDLAGNTFPADSLDPSKLGLFLTVNQKGIAAGAAISSLGADKETSAEEFHSLKRQWIEFRLIAPGGENRTIRRDLYDSQLYDTPEKRAMALTRTVALTVPVGQPSPAKIAHDFIDQMVKLIETNTQKACPGSAGCGDTSLDPDLQNLLLANLFSDFSNRVGRQLAPGTVSYRNEPGLIARSTHQLMPLERETADIIHSTRMTLSANGDRLIASNADAMRFGLAESVMERQLVTVGDGTTAAGLLLNSKSQQWKIIKDESQLQGLNLARDHLAYMTRDLVAGYSLIVNEDESDDQAMKSWWRVDTATGETLGMLSNGTGGSVWTAVAAAPAAGNLILRTTGQSLTQVVKYKGAKAWACIMAGVTIAILLSTVISAVLAPAAPAITIVKALQAIGMSSLAPTATAMASQWAQAISNWKQLVGYLVEQCILRV